METETNSMTEQGIITNIQRFSLHDGPGVRSTVFFKGCPLRCLWCHNPETYSFAPVLSWDAKHCIACASCADACKTGALVLTEGGLTCDDARCARCFSCAAACPSGALSVLGRTVTVDEVMGEILPDQGLYARTGGGVTLSGGEVCAQPRFAMALMRALHARHITAALDTCGHAESETFLALAREADVILFDLKHADDAAHKRLTGRGFSLIRRNFQLLRWENTPVQVRVPVIPGLNDDDDTHRAIAELIRENPKVESVVLLGYHPLGNGKLMGLNETRAALTLTPPPRQRLNALAAAMAERTGLPCTFR